MASALAMKNHFQWIVVGLVVVVLSVVSAILPVEDWIRSFSDWVRQLGPLGVILFIVTYALATVLFLPGWIFTVSAGLIYGVMAGTLIALAGALLGATLAFLIARHILRKNVEQLTASNPKFKAIDQAIGKNGWKIVGLLRLSPLVPFNLSNYFYGITSISPTAYVVVSAIGMLPGALLYTYLGAIGKTGLGGGTAPRSNLQCVFLGVGLIATMAVTILISRIARHALKKTGAVE